MENNTKPVIVISGINLRSGGTLSIFQDCLGFLSKNYVGQYEIVALVHDEKMFDSLSNIEFVSFPKSVKSYFYRIYYEYFYFKKLSQKIKPFLWLSLHDTTPNVVAERRAVYCHNPSMAYKPSFQQMTLDPKYALFSHLYKFVYRHNICKNDYVIVQQQWLRDMFRKMFNLGNVVVAHPSIEQLNLFDSKLLNKNSDGCYHFFYPTLPRIFKNIRLIIDAVRLLNKQNDLNFDVTITISGDENKYAKQIIRYAREITNIKFIGRVSRKEVFDIFQETDCLIFPSKLETWGLPISEFKYTNKPILLADEVYAHETVGSYDFVSFFDSDDASMLANLMYESMTGTLKPTASKLIPIPQPYCKDWSELFDLLLHDYK